MPARHRFHRSQHLKMAPVDSRYSTKNFYSLIYLFIMFILSGEFPRAAETPFPPPPSFPRLRTASSGGWSRGGRGSGEVREKGICHFTCFVYIFLPSLPKAFFLDNTPRQHRFLAVAGSLLLIATQRHHQQLHFPHHLSKHPPLPCLAVPLPQFSFQFFQSASLTNPGTLGPSPSPGRRGRGGQGQSPPRLEGRGRQIGSRGTSRWRRERHKRSF